MTNLATLSHPAAPWRVWPVMHAHASTHVAADPHPSALVLEYQRVVARLTQAGIITPDEALRRVRSMMQARAVAEQRHQQLTELVFHLVLSLADGTLKQGEHVMQLAGDRVAVHPETVAGALYRAQRGRLVAHELRRLLRLAAQQFPQLVPDTAARVRFARRGDRRRAIVLHVPSAREFVSEPPCPVPSR